MHKRLEVKEYLVKAKLWELPRGASGIPEGGLRDGVCYLPSKRLEDNYYNDL